MGKKKIYREKGTGSIEKKRNRFYLKMRLGGICKSIVLRKSDDTPVTTRKEAEEAAKLLRPVLRAEQKEEIAVYVAEARKLKQSRSITIDHIWETYLAQYKRPDSGESTLKNYRKVLGHFTDWLKKEYPHLTQVSKITDEIASEFFLYEWNTRQISGKTFNIYKQTLHLIFKHIQEPAGLESNPFDSIQKKPVDVKSREAFTEEQIQMIFSGFDLNSVFSDNHVIPEVGFPAV